MSSRDLSTTGEDGTEPASAEVQFALVISRMLETVQNHPAHMRQVVYDLARYKLDEQFTHADAQDIRRSRQALETAIRGVEEFSQQQVSIPPPSVPQLPGSGLAVARQPPIRELPPAAAGTSIGIERGALRGRPPSGPSQGERPYCCLLPVRVWSPRCNGSGSLRLQATSRARNGQASPHHLHR